jgi:DNA-binding response OmpR family regulator
MSETAQSSAVESRPRVLAVDDQEDALKLLGARLRAAGFDCLPCNSGERALELLTCEPVDLIITDVIMPGMDGYEFCHRVKRDPRTADIPVLFLTANSEMEDKVRGLEVGGHDYLSKPVDQQELLARTRAALRVKHLQDELRKKLELQEEIGRLHQRVLSEHWQKTLGQLVAGLAHEINNPLAVALGSAQLLGYDASLSPEVHNRLKIIDQSLQRAAHKVRSLLFLAQNRREPQTIRVDELIRDLLVLINYRVVIEKITVQPDIEERCECHGIPSDLGRALLFILNNAVEIMIGKPERVLAIVVERTGSQVHVRIASQGDPIPEELRGRIFQPVVSGGSATDSSIGLHLAYEFVQRAGGRIECVSPSPLGAVEFAVYLPVFAAPVV